MSDKTMPSRDSTSLQKRFASWLGIYLSAYLLMVWYWPGEIHDWASPLLVPQGLLWLNFGALGSPVGWKTDSVFYLSYGVYLLLLILILVIPKKKIFLGLILAFALVASFSAIGSAKYGSITIGMTDRVAR